MPYDVAKVKEIFLAALEIPRLIERQKYVDSACGTDADLRNCVQDMLDAHQKLLTPVPLGPTVAESAPSKPFAATLPAGTVIDQRYKIIELIAEGGMGAVYRACRVADMRMEVAIKLVKPGMASEQILQRFNIERQALALMKHENIAKVLDAGSTREGYPYFVMELVKGLPITRFCDDNKLTVHERLELFEKVCLAVQHAHQKGIVHRDLKPSNIMVALYDDKPVPKVIDFGLAKALNQPLTDDILHTKFGTFVGTWQYTAPEQAVLNNLDIDTRADIYSLGVILYELLTGNPPIEKSRITHAVMEEVLRIIREEEPLKPSTKIHSSEQLPSIAALRRSEPVQLEREIRGELDWIVMKALEKDRNRRYTTANDLARDLTAYLIGEHVAAAPPSKVYQMRCFYRKHRAKVLTIAAIATLLLITALTSTIGYIQVKRSEMKAKEQLAAANALADFIDRGMFASIDPLERAKFNLPMENNVQVRDMLARSAVNVESGAFSDQPVVEMRIRYTLGKAFFAVGENDAASKQLATSDKIAINLFGDMSEERLIILEKKGDVAYNQGNYSQAKNDYHLASTGWHTHGKGNCHHSLMAQIKKLEIEKSETEKPEILQSLVLQVQSLLKQIAEVHDHMSFVQAKLLLADLHSQLNQPDSVLTELETTLRYASQNLGPVHPNTMAVMNSLASEQHARQKVDAAEKTYQDLMKLAERVYDADNIILALYRNNYAALCVEKKNYPLADKLFQEAIPIFQKVSPNHSYTLIARSNVADMKLLKRDFAGALAGYQVLAPLFLSTFGERRTEYQTLLRDMSRSYVELDKIDDAIVQLKKLIKIAVDTNGNETQQLMLGLKLIKRSLAQKDKAKAYDNMIEQLAEYLRQLSPNQSQLLNSIRGVK